MSGGVGHLWALVPCGSDGQLVYGGSVCGEPSRGVGRLLESKGEEMGTTCEASTLWDALLDSSIQVRLSGWGLSGRGFGWFA